jgi:GntR family transcriptional regulator of vanillate catabolism
MPIMRLGINSVAKNIEISPYATSQEKAYLQTRKLIESGEIKVGQRIPERELSARLGCSRIPIRESLLRLQADGLVYQLPRGGFVVREYSIKEIISIFELREAIEGYAAHIVADNGKDEHIEKICAIHDKFANFGIELKKTPTDIDDEDFQRWKLMDIDFHETILEASENTHFLEVLRQFNGRLVAVNLNKINKFLGVEIRQEENKDFDLETIKWHKAVVDAIKNRKGKEAEIAMRTHIHFVTEKYQKLMNLKTPL